MHIKWNQKNKPFGYKWKLRSNSRIDAFHWNDYIPFCQYRNQTECDIDVPSMDILYSNRMYVVSGKYFLLCGVFRPNLEADLITRTVQLNENWEKTDVLCGKWSPFIRMISQMIRMINLWYRHYHLEQFLNWLEILRHKWNNICLLWWKALAYAHNDKQNDDDINAPFVGWSNHFYFYSTAYSKLPFRLRNHHKIETTTSETSMFVPKLHQLCMCASS